LPEVLVDPSRPPAVLGSARASSGVNFIVPDAQLSVPDAQLSVPDARLSVPDA
jgi:hypothetical protein